MTIKRLMLGVLATLAVTIPVGAVTAGISHADTAPTIPSGAVLQPADLPGADIRTLSNGELSELRPLRPCGGRYASDQARQAAVAKSYVVGTNSGDGVGPSQIVEFVGRYRSGAAAQAYDQVAAALARCPGSVGHGTRRWTVLDTGFAGDESALVRIDTLPLEHSTAQKADYAAVIRVGDYLLVVADRGWEAGSGREGLVRRLSTVAASRAASAG